MTVLADHYTACPAHDTAPSLNQDIRAMFRSGAMRRMPYNCEDCRRATRRTILESIGKYRTSKATYKGKWWYDRPCCCTAHRRGPTVRAGDCVETCARKLRDWYRATVTAPNASESAA